MAAALFQGGHFTSNGKNGKAGRDQHPIGSSQAKKSMPFGREYSVGRSIVMTRSQQHRNSGFARLAGVAGPLVLLVTAIAPQAQTFTAYNRSRRNC